jgi:hypothetical protein
MSLAFKQEKRALRCRRRDRDFAIGSKDHTFVAGEGEEARGPADRKALGNDVAVAVVGKLEHNVAGPSETCTADTCSGNASMCFRRTMLRSG